MRIYKRYSKQRVRKNYMTQSEYNNLIGLMESNDVESQLLGLKLLRDSKTVKHYRKFQKFNLGTITKVWKYNDKFVYLDIYEMLNDIIYVLKHSTVSLKDLKSSQYSYKNFYVDNLFFELKAWLISHTITHPNVTDLL